MAQPVSVQTQPPTSNATVPQQPVQSAPPPPAQQAITHDTLFGRMAKTLLGTAQNYTVDPKTGNTITTPQEQKPGQLFRSILAGALLGGAAAQQSHNRNPNMGFGGGVVTGGAANVYDARQQDQLRRDQAQQQFQNQLTAQKAEQESDEAKTHQQLMKANIANANLQTLRLNQLIQGTSFDQHQEIAAAGKAQIQPYLDAGMQPVVSDISESQMAQYMKDHPGATALDWEHTGTKTVLDANGNPHFESTLTAFDPKGTVKISRATYDQWKSDGVFKRFPEYEDILKPGKSLTAQQYVAVKRNADGVRADTMARQQQDLKSQEALAHIRAYNAQTAHSVAETMRARQEMADDTIGKTQAKQFGSALEELDKAGGDISKISPSSRVLIGESAAKMMPSLNQEIRSVLASDDPDKQAKADDLMKQLDSLRSLSVSVLSGVHHGAAGNPNPQVAQALQKIPGVNPQMIDQIAGMSLPEVKANLATSRLPQNVKDQILQAFGEKPAPAAPLTREQQAEHQVGQEIKQGVGKFFARNPGTTTVQTLRGPVQVPNQ